MTPRHANGRELTLAERGEAGQGPAESESPPPFGGWLGRWRNVYAFVFVSQVVFVALLAVFAEVCA